MSISNSALNAAAKFLGTLKTRFYEEINGRTFVCMSCEKTYCCNQLILLTYMEGALIARELLERGRNDIIEKLLAANEQLQTISPPTGKYKPAELAKMITKLANDHAKLDVPCPLLENGKCLVYDMRPVICWSYFVKTGSPEKCHVLQNEGVDIVAVSAGMYNLIGNADRVFVEAAIGIKVPISMAPLPVAVLTWIMALQSKAYL